jgi:hypothetical protein
MSPKIKSKPCHINRAHELIECLDNIFDNIEHYQAQEVIRLISKLEKVRSNINFLERYLIKKF